MRIGINASFLRKPGTGIGQVTLHFLKNLTQLPGMQSHEFILYLDEAVGTCQWPANFSQRVFLPWWKRDDVPRKYLWEKKLARVAQRDGCQAFLSLAQSATVFPKNFRHIMVVHDLIPLHFPEYTTTLSRTWHQKAIARGIRECTEIVAVSEATKRDLERWGVGEKTITMAHPGVSEIFYERLSEENLRTTLSRYSLAPGYLYHGGGLEVRKNTEAVLRAYAALLKRSPDPVPPLVISGRIFPESNTLATPVKKIVRELGLEKSVVCTEFVPEADLPALYQGALYFLYPSLYEGFGLPVAEALASGTPVITSNTSSLPEVGGEAVVYVDPKSTEELTEAMQKLLTEEPIRRELISKSRVQALQFQWKAFTQTTALRLTDFI